jgi:5-methylcytosine-specific restriction endonuclease McrA
VTRKERYAEYLQSEEWRKKRRLILARNDDNCERCGIGHATEVHHLTYKRVFKERPSDLQALCSECHRFTHGKTTVDPSKGAIEMTLDPKEGSATWGCGEGVRFGTTLIKCPICSDEYVHFGAAKNLDGGDVWGGTVVWPGRGDALVVPMWCEGGGHEWNVVFGHHKGNSYALVRDMRSRRDDEGSWLWANWKHLEERFGA